MKIYPYISVIVFFCHVLKMMYVTSNMDVYQCKQIKS